MRPGHAYRALLAAALAPIAFLAVHPDVAAAATPARVMFLGDSITGSPGCWRATLWNRLRDAGHTDIDAVGTLPAQGCSTPHDGDNEGHGGALVTTVAAQNQLVGWLAATRPDIVVMHFGTNDVWSNRSTNAILDAYSRLVDQMRASNPRMKILVAKIIPLNPATCGECGQRTVTLNNAIPGWAAGMTTVESPIVVVDQWTGFNTTTDTYDGVHPNSTGDQKLSDRWYPALSAALRGGTPSAPPSVSPSASRSPSPSASPSGGPSPSPSRSRPSPSTPTSPGAGGCAATYRIGNQWPGGFQGEVIVTNLGAASIPGWTVRFTFPDGQIISQSWSATVTQTGAAVTAQPMTWNRGLAAGAATSFGFVGSWHGTNGTPVATCGVG